MRTVNEIVEQISAQYAEDVMKHVHDSWALDIILRSAAADAYKAALEDVLESQQEVHEAILGRKS